MTKILIDTNIFLGLYESNEDTVDIFKDIEKIKTKLVIPQQIYDEFLRNRDRILRTLIQNIKNADQKGMHLTALIRHLAEYESLKDAKRELSQINNTLIQKIEEMISDPTKDPIFSRFTELYVSRSVSKIKKSDALIQKAFLRKLSGNPPVSPKQDTIGDEIIWESILEHVNDDLILVTRDGTYKAHSTFLIEEYRKATGKSLSIFDKMSDALKKVGEAPSDKLVQFEKEREQLTSTNAMPCLTLGELAAEQLISTNAIPYLTLGGLAAKQLTSINAIPYLTLGELAAYLTLSERAAKHTSDKTPREEGDDGQEPQAGDSSKQ